MANCDTCGGDDFRSQYHALRDELMRAIENKKKAELIATQATSELGRCFLKYQQTCVAYNDLKREKESEQAVAAALCFKMHCLLPVVCDDSVHTIACVVRC
jgi:hypothetical protein